MNDTQTSSTTIAAAMVKKADEPIRYSDGDLAFFKRLIQEKLKTANDVLKNYRESQTNPNSGDEFSPSYKGFESGLEMKEKEDLWKLISRQESLISCLEGALFRIENKTYGICRETGRLIPKERLMAVPHATLCIEAKLVEHNNKDKRKSR